jgi:hypothetical protein
MKDSNCGFSADVTAGEEKDVSLHEIMKMILSCRK